MKRIIEKYSLSRIILASFALILVVSISTSFFVVKQQEERIVESIIRDKIDIARLVNDVAISTMIDGKTPILEDFFVKKIGKLNNINIVMVVDSDGRILLSNGHKGRIAGEAVYFIAEAIVLRETLVRDMSSATGDPLKVIIYPGYDDKAVLIGASMKGVQEEMGKWTMAIFTFTILILFMIYSFIYWVLSITIMSPIKRMSESYTKVGKGDLNVRMDSGGPREIKKLADSFNDMMDDISKYQLQLEGSKNILEEEIKKRTEDLRKANENLEEGIKERTEELQIKINELEKFHRLTTGRELRILELKKEIDGLKKKIDGDK